MSNREWISAVVLGLIVTALFWIDPIFVPLALLGPIVIGVVAGAVLDGLLETSPWLLFLGVLVGVLVAFYALYDVSRTYGDRNRQ